MKRRQFLTSSVAIGLSPAIARASSRGRRLLLRSSWQSENIGDIAHTPGMLALLEKHRPEDLVTLWPKRLSPEVETLLTTRFPRLAIAKTKDEQADALRHCDLFVHGSGPGLVGSKEADRARTAGKRYGFGGITLSDDELRTHRRLLAEAEFLFLRDTDSLKAFQKAGIDGPMAAFGPDATFALDLRDDAAATRVLNDHRLEPGEFLCAVPRLRWTPYWEIRPDEVKPNPTRIAENRAFVERDHAKLREAIVAWVRHTGKKVFVVPEMTYEVPLLRPLLFDPLPADVKPRVAVLDRYWLTAEAASVYAQAAAVVSFEMHSPIIAIANGTPAIHLRQPTDTRKGQMWRDVGLEPWLFEIDHSTGQQIAERVVEIGCNPRESRLIATKARAFAHERLAAMVAAFG